MKLCLLLGYRQSPGWVTRRKMTGAFWLLRGIWLRAGCQLKVDNPELEEGECPLEDGECPKTPHPSEVGCMWQRLSTPSMQQRLVRLPQHKLKHRTQLHSFGPHHHGDHYIYSAIWRSTQFWLWWMRTPLWGSSILSSVYRLFWINSIKLTWITAYSFATIGRARSSCTGSCHLQWGQFPHQSTTFKAKKYEVTEEQRDRADYPSCWGTGWPGLLSPVEVTFGTCK